MTSALLAPRTERAVRAHPTVARIVADDAPPGALSAEVRVVPLDASALDLTLRALRPLLARPEVTELCINSPHRAFIETATGWHCEPLPFADFEWCRRLAKLVANSTRQRIAEETPLLSAALPSGERIQIVLPPATSPDCVAITIRRPAQRVWSLEELAQRGIFARTRRSSEVLDDTEVELLALLERGEHEAFMRLAVRSRKNIVVSGPTGSGKTTYTKALIREIPSEERLITIEDAQELTLDGHANHVRLFYSKDEQGLARITPKAAPRILPAHATGPDTARGAARGGSVRLPAQCEFRASGLDHESACGECRAGLRAARAARQAIQGRTGSLARGH